MEFGTGEDETSETKEDDGIEDPSVGGQAHSEDRDTSEAPEPPETDGDDGDDGGAGLNLSDAVSKARDALSDDGDGGESEGSAEPIEDDESDEEDGGLSIWVIGAAVAVVWFLFGDSGNNGPRGV